MNIPKDKSPRISLPPDTAFFDQPPTSIPRPRKLSEISEFLQPSHAGTDRCEGDDTASSEARSVEFDHRLGDSISKATEPSGNGGDVELTALPTCGDVESNPSGSSGSNSKHRSTSTATTRGTSGDLSSISSEEAPTAAGPAPPIPGPAPQANLAQNWTPSHRHILTAHLSLSSLLALSCASAPSPLLPQLSTALSNPTPPSSSTTLLILAIYFLALGLSPLLLAPLSEHPSIGRRPILLGSQLLFSVANALTPISRPDGRPNLALLLVMRFLAGVGAATPIVLSGPVMRDLYPLSEERGRALALVGGAVYLGPALGPILGGVVGRYAGWRWVFWIMAIVGGLLVVWGWWAVRESSIAKISEGGPHRSKRLEASLFRKPFRIFMQRPALQVIASLNGLGFGIYVIVLSTFATLWIEQYGQSEATASLHYIAIALGASIACQGSGRLMDRVYRRLKTRYLGRQTDKQAPEFRMPMLALAVFIIPVGLIWYGWAAERHAHWLVVDFAVAVWCVGTFGNAQTLLAYTLDEFGEHAASAGAASKFWGYLASFLFPLFAPELYKRLGYGNGNTLLAIVFVVVAWPAPFLMWMYGPRLRAARWWSLPSEGRRIVSDSKHHHRRILA